MEIRYIRKLMTSHMVIGQTAVPDEWESSMIAHASLESVLFAESVCEDGKSELWYDITGKQSLDVLLESRELGYDLLCRILMGIYDAAEGLEGILLRAESLLLEPECIFGDYDAEHIWVCYCPGNTGTVDEAFLRLMEYLLTKFDHEDTRAVELAYGIYGEAAKSGFRLGRIKEEVRLSYREEEQPEETEYRQEESPDVPGEGELPEEDTDGTQRRGLENVIHRLWMEWQKKLPQSVRGFLKKRPCKKTQREKVEERFVFEPEEEQPETVTRPTVLLGEICKKPEGIFRYEGAGQCADLTVVDGECLIGSDPLCGGYIPSQTVSRKHARVTRVDDIYFLEDLNSSNGTYVGGEPLNYKTKMSLQKNEVVLFADEKFRFI